MSVKPGQAHWSKRRGGQSTSGAQRPLVGHPASVGHRAADGAEDDQGKRDDLACGDVSPAYERLDRHAGSHQREGGTDPGEERPLVGQRESGIGLDANTLDPSRSAPVGLARPGPAVRWYLGRLRHWDQPHHVSTSREEWSSDCVLVTAVASVKNGRRRTGRTGRSHSSGNVSAWQRNGVETVYNLTVEEIHTYFVGVGDDEDVPSSVELGWRPGVIRRRHPPWSV
jgi:hypothetical protein